MSLQVEVVKNFVGKPLVDLYGRKLGYIVGFFTDARNDVISIEVELGTGEFCNFPGSQFSFSGGSAMLLPAWKADSNAFNGEYVPLVRKMHALEELYSKGEVPQEIYNDFHRQYENELKSLEEHRSALISSLNDRISKLDSQTKWLQTSLTSIKLHHLAGELDDNSFQAASDSIRNGLEVISTEKKDIETTLSEVTKLDAASIIPPPAQKPSEPAQSKTGEETPIVVHVDNASH